MEKQWQYPHRRWNPLRRSWVMVSPHRTQRPWQGEVSKTAAPASLTYDPECYLCPGNKRANGETNPEYPKVFSFVNDYAAVLPDPVWADVSQRVAAELGIRPENLLLAAVHNHGAASLGATPANTLQTYRKTSARIRQ